MLVSTLPKLEEVLIPIAGAKTNEHDGVANDLITRRFIAGLIVLARSLQSLQWNCALPWPLSSEPMPHNLGSEPTANITKGKGLLVGDGWAMIKRMLE